MRIGVLTARFKLREPVAPPPADAAWAYCFSDYAAAVAPGWRFRLQTGDRRTARVLKLAPWDACPADVDWYLWVDSNAEITVPLAEIAAATGESLYVSPHPLRRCVYRELEACVKLRKDDPRVMRAQVDRYRVQGMPADAGMVETGLLLWKNDARARRFAAHWAREVRYGSARDQLSFNYVAWKHGLTYGLFPRPARTAFLRLVRHQPAPALQGV